MGDIKATKKGIRLLSLSYFLGIHLRRWTFNYHTLETKDGHLIIVHHNKKTNFPEYFNANQYLNSECDKQAIESYAVDFDLDKNDNNTSVNENIDNSLAAMFYEVYSIFIHGGGGHYYAYIKEFENDDWITFNDSSAHKIPKKECVQIFTIPQAKRLLKPQAPAATTTEKTGETENEKEKEHVTTASAPEPKDNKKTDAEISKQKKLDTGAQLAATRNENDQFGIILYIV